MKSCDWLLILCLIVVTAVLESPSRYPFRQCIPGFTTSSNSDGSSFFPCGEAKDPSLEYPFKTQTVSEALLIFLAFGPWAVTLVANVAVLGCHDKTADKRMVAQHIEVLLRMMMFSAAGTEALVSVMKFSVGRPRPNFYALMERTSSGSLSSNHKQSRMSFPSGHSSLAFSLLFLLTLNLFDAMRFAQNRMRKHKKQTLRIVSNSPHCYFYLHWWWLLRHYQLLSVLLVLSPVLLAVYIACSRVTDYWHHYSDIAVGALLGIGGAVVAFIVIRGELLTANNNGDRGQPTSSLIVEERSTEYVLSRGMTREQNGKEPLDGNERLRINADSVRKEEMLGTDPLGSSSGNKSADSNTAVQRI